MALANTNLTELNGLKELKQLCNQKNENQDRIDTLNKQINFIREKANSAESSTEKLRTDNAEEKRKEIEENIKAKAISAQKNTHTILFFITLVLCIIHGFLAFRIFVFEPVDYPNTLHAISVTIPFTYSVLISFKKGLFAVAAKSEGPDDDTLSSASGCFSFVLYILFIISSLLAFIPYFDYFQEDQMNPPLLILPPLIVVLAIIASKFRKEPTLRKTNTEENQSIAAAEALDTNNRTANENADKKARGKALNAVQGDIMQLKQKIEEYEQENRALQQKIDSNPFIHPDFVKHIDRLIRNMEYGYANDIQQSLLLLRDELDKEQKALLDAAMAQLNNRFDRWQREQDAYWQRQREDALNAAADRRAKDIQNKIDEVYKDYEYHQKHGWN